MLLGARARTAHARLVALPWVRFGRQAVVPRKAVGAAPRVVVARVMSIAWRDVMVDAALDVWLNRLIAARAEQLDSRDCDRLELGRLAGNLVAIEEGESFSVATRSSEKLDDDRL